MTHFEQVASAMAKFTQSLHVLEWLKANGMLKDEQANTGEIAFQFAMGYESPVVIDAFVDVAKMTSAATTNAQLPNKRTSKMSSADTDAALETRERQFAQLALGQALAGGIQID